MAAVSTTIALDGQTALGTISRRALSTIAFPSASPVFTMRGLRSGAFVYWTAPYLDTTGALAGVGATPTDIVCLAQAIQ